MENEKTIVAIGCGEALDPLLTENDHDVTQRIACDVCLPADFHDAKLEGLGIRFVGMDATMFLGQKQNKGMVDKIVAANLFGDPRIELITTANAVRSKGTSGENYSATVHKVDDAYIKKEQKKIAHGVDALLKAASGGRASVASVATSDPEAYSLALEMVLEGQYEKLPPHKRIAILKAAYASLKPGGELIINETLTPYDRQKMAQILQIAGFKNTHMKLIDQVSGNQEYAAALHRYNLAPEMPDRKEKRGQATVERRRIGLPAVGNEPYIIIATKA